MGPLTLHHTSWISFFLIWISFPLFFGLVWLGLFARLPPI